MDAELIERYLVASAALAERYTEVCELAESTLEGPDEVAVFRKACREPLARWVVLHSQMRGVPLTADQQALVDAGLPEKQN